MNLHALLGHKPGSINIDSLLTEATKGANITGIVPVPNVKIYKDAVYYSYLPLGISFNFEPSTPLSTVRNAPKPDPSLLTLVAIHLYSHPMDKFATFPLSFTVSIQPSQGSSAVTMVELDMTKKAHEVVSLLGEPEKKEGGGRAGNCWIGYQSSLGVSCDLRGADWEDRNMALGCITISNPEK